MGQRMLVVNILHTQKLGQRMLVVNILRTQKLGQWMLVVNILHVHTQDWRVGTMNACS
jgi:hypothetical protein